MPSTHAILSPSGAVKWLNCSPSAVLEAALPDSSSDYTREGTLAHAYCAKALKTYLKQSTESEDKEIEEYSEYHTAEMDDCVETYKQIVLDEFMSAKHKASDAKLHVERQLDLTRYIPHSFGTSDCVIISDEEMVVLDFKYGKGVEVDATNNPQMMIYALGAYDEFSLDYDIEKIKMIIVQPRLNHVSSFELQTVDLVKWAAEVLIPRAAIAFQGEGEQNVGSWCRFCKVKSQCKKIAELGSAMVNSGDKYKLDKEFLSKQVLPFLSTFKAWIGEVETFALNQALQGQKIDGYKVVEGRSIRKITDTDKLVNKLIESGIAETELYKPKEVRSLSDLEKLVGKKKFYELSKGLIYKPNGKPTLVPVDDKREEWNSAIVDFKDIDIDNN